MQSKSVTVHCLCGAAEEVCVPEGDKVGVVCERCSRLWDVTADGAQHRSPLAAGTRVTEAGTIYENPHFPGRSISGD